jgi:hypothetical protein
MLSLPSNNKEQLVEDRERQQAIEDDRLADLELEERRAAEKEYGSSSSGSINLATIPVNVPSLCIPRVFANMTEKCVRSTIQELGLGEIDHIDMVSRTSDKGEPFQRVFIHLVAWGKGVDAVRARVRLLEGKDIKIVYDDPWFWKVSANRATARSALGPRINYNKPKPKYNKPSISFDNNSDRDEKQDGEIQRLKARNQQRAEAVNGRDHGSYYGLTNRNAVAVAGQIIRTKPSRFGPRLVVAVDAPTLVVVVEPAATVETVSHLEVEVEIEEKVEEKEEPRQIDYGVVVVPTIKRRKFVVKK